MDIENAWREICSSCGGECCKGAYGLGTWDEQLKIYKNIRWFFPNKVRGEFFHPRDATLEDKRRMINSFAKDKGPEMECKSRKKGGCDTSDHSRCNSFYCAGIIDMLEDLVINT